MDYIIMLMLILLPLIVPFEFQKIMVYVLVNTISILYYDNQLRQFVISYHVVFRFFTIFGLTLIMVLVWKGHRIMYDIYGMIVLTIITTIINCFSKLISSYLI